ncbi:hypothetical protein K2X05_05250 [bacterium]|nr:hypothetical protein [bacterium]
MIILNLLINIVFAVSTDPECYKHVIRNHEKRLVRLEQEGVIVRDKNGNLQPTLTIEELYADPAYRNYPAISFEQIKWCPKMESVNTAISFLTKVGFKAHNMDTYFKGLLYLSYNKDLPVLKDQIGVEDGRQSFIKWTEQNPNQKTLVSHYAMAVYKNPVDEKIQARAGSNYIGNRGKSAVFTLPYHALFVDGNKKTCADFEFYFPKAAQHPLKAQSTLSEIPKMDIVFCELILTENQKELKPALLDSSEVLKNTPFMTLGVGTNKTSQKLELTIDASSECQSLVKSNEGNSYDSGVIDTETWRWAMGCDVSAGNSGDAIYHRETGKLIGFVTARSKYIYQSLAPSVFAGSLDLERLYMETSHFVPLSEIKKHGPLPID